MLKRSLLFLVFLPMSFYLHAENSLLEWKRIGPEGEGWVVDEFISNRNYPDVIYGIGKERWLSYKKGRKVLYKSNNGGESWTASFLNLPPRPVGFNGKISVSAKNPHILFLNGKESSDNGIHWTESNPAQDFLIKNINDVWVIDKDEKNKVLYGITRVYRYMGHTPVAFYSLHKSTDNGVNWVEITPFGIARKSGFSELVVTQGDSGRLFFREWVSINRGKSWVSLEDISPDASGIGIKTVFPDPKNASVLYSAVHEPIKTYDSKLANSYYDASKYGPRLIKTYDSGETWQEIWKSTPDSEATTWAEVWSSMSAISYNASKIKIIVNPKNNQKLVMFDGDGAIVYSQNGGESWEYSDTDFRFSAGENLLAIAKDNSQIMYTYQRGEILASVDGGLYWETMTQGGMEEITPRCRQLLVNPLQNKELLCLSGGSLFKSVDAGKTWTVIVVFKDKNKGWAVYASDGQTIYTYFNSRGLLYRKSDLMSKSIDGGESWKKISTMDANFGLPIVDPRNPDIIYAINLRSKGSVSDLYKSDNGGDSWKKIVNNDIENLFIKKGALVIDPVNPDRLMYLVKARKNRERHLLLSEDGGDSWDSVKLPDGREVPKIVFDPNDSNGLFWAREKKGIYHSNDMGMGWTLLNNKENNINLQVHVASKKIFGSSPTGLFELSGANYFTKTSDCLFQWAENNYPSLFSPNSTVSQQWGGYTYRFYGGSNTYLGFFNQQEIHLKKADLTRNIDVVGFVRDYHDLTGCY